MNATDQRPALPGDVVEPALAGDGSDAVFLPAPDLGAWALGGFVDPDSPLANPDHAHLVDARIGWLWTNLPHRRQGLTVAGQAEIPMFRAGAWARGRQEHQLLQWFGAPLPDFIITLSGPIAADLDDATFCALVEHELYHCGQQVDEFGAPKFSRTTGLPLFAIRGHDVEEFVGIVRRYGVAAAAGQTAALVEAAGRPPEIGVAALSRLCGTCERVAA